MNLNQITIPSVNLLKSVAFYELLGLTLIVDALPRYARFECPDGTSTFSIHQVETLAMGPGVIIYFECKKLDDYVQQLIKQGIIFDELPTDRTWLWREATLKDPDNNQLILYFAGKNRKDPPWRL